MDGHGHLDKRYIVLYTLNELSCFSNEFCFGSTAGELAVVDPSTGLLVTFPDNLWIDNFLRQLTVE